MSRGAGGVGERGIPLLLYGASGRMGTAVRSMVEGPGSGAGSGAGEILLRACVARKPAGACPEGCVWIEAAAFGPKSIEALPPDGVVLDVSVAAGTEALVAALERAPRATVFATTGVSPSVEVRIDALARRVPIVRARNLSLGIGVARAWIEATPGVGRREFTADVTEHHHAGKKDAPSGTALDLIALLGAMGEGRRPGGDVGVHAIRAGSVPGTHRVLLSGDGETLELVHTVYDRGVFARGALRAVRFVHGRAPGRYTADDVLVPTNNP